MIPAGFHFLRPEWLYAVIPALFLAVLAWRSMARGRDDWRNVVDAHLLRHLAVRDARKSSRWPVVALLLGWVLGAVAMAGPTWQKVPTPTLDQLDPTVVVMSLAQSMNATDQNPTRLTAARHKVQDMLSRMRGGQVGFVIFADVPFVASPLTEDGRVIAQMLPELATDLMPVLADRPDLAIDKAVDLLKNTGAPSGRIVLVSDGLGDNPDATMTAARAAVRAGYIVSVVGVGTTAGTVLVGYDGSTLRGKDGNPLMTRLDETRLSQLAAAGHGQFSVVTADGRDLDTIFAKSLASRLDNPLQDSGLTADQWVDMGPWLVIAVALLASLAFRRGWVVGIVFAFSLSGGSGLPRAVAGPLDGPSPAQLSDPGPAPAATGGEWKNLWQRPDQQGAQAFGSADYQAAARAFQDPAWQGSALYKGGDYEQAASTFAGVPGNDYNAGNALAHAGKLEDAIKAYDAALAANPDPKSTAHADAAYNRDLVQQMLALKQKQQQQQQDQQKQDQQKQNEQKQDQQQSQGGNSNQKDQKPDPSKDQQAKAEPKPDPKGDPKSDPKSDPKGEQPPKDNAQDQKQQDQKQQDQKPEDPKQQGQQAGGTKPTEPPKPAEKTPPQQAQPAKPEDKQPDDKQAPQAVAVKPMTEQDQTREQALRMVPDDPTGLLRARIRSHYLGAAVPVTESQ